MAVTLNGSTNLISGMTDWSGIQAVRTTYNDTVVSANSQGDFYLNCEITMPAVKRTGNKYRIIAYAQADDTNSAAAGVGLCLLGYDSGLSNNYWICRQGLHSIYQDGGADHYFAPDIDFVTDGTDWSGYSGGFTVGNQYKFRLYAHANNSNINYNTGVGGRIGYICGLMVFEISGDL
jgi:hypothetical protein